VWGCGIAEAYGVDIVVVTFYSEDGFIAFDVEDVDGVISCTSNDFFSVT
jgi:hypothetical protein